MLCIFCILCIFCLPKTKQRKTEILKFAQRYLSVRTATYRNQSIDLHCQSIDWFLYSTGLQ